MPDNIVEILKNFEGIFPKQQVQLKLTTRLSTNENNYILNQMIAETNQKTQRESKNIQVFIRIRPSS